MAEKEYIERESAYPLAKKICDAIDSKEFKRLNFGHRILDWIDEIPAADVRPVVLCRDCEYYFKDEDGYAMCENSEGYDHVTADGFCAWGEKREES